MFSGISTGVVERIASTLNANGIDPVVVRLSDGGLDQDYFDRLLAQTLAAARHLLNPATPHAAFLVSGLPEGEGKVLETATFSPALRRVGINPAWRNNLSAAHRVAAAAISYFQDRGEKKFTRSVSIRQEARLLLPARNTRCKGLIDAFGAIYEGKSTSLGGRVERDVALVRKRKCYRIYGVDFAPAENNGRHPVRRCSPTDKCDLDALYRFGAPVGERVEFDVTSETGLRNKTFLHCDGARDSFGREPTHVNMRINGDFEFA